MKILNEGNLVQFAIGNSAVDKEGWLYKKSDTGKSFHRRWCVLKGNLFFYFEKPLDKDPHGVIILEGHTVELADNDMDHFTFQISFRTPGGSRRYVLVADSSDIMESWMKSITCASYTYMRALLAGLQSQLDGLNSQELERSLPSSSKISFSGSPTGGHRRPTTVAVSEEDSNHSTSSPRQARRRNPFNTNSMNDALDCFGQTSFVAAVKEPEHPPSPPTRSKKLKQKKDNSQFYTQGLDAGELKSRKNGLSESLFYTTNFATSKFDDLHKQYKTAIYAAIQSHNNSSETVSSEKVLDLIGFG